MGFGSIWHWVIVLIIVIVLFGRGRVSEIMGDFGKGIKSFKQGMSEEESAKPAPQIKAPEAKPAEPASEAEPQPAPRNDSQA